MFRQGLKTALSINMTVNNEIVYTESGEWPLQIRITKQQLKFWMSIQDMVQNKPNHYISKLVTIAADYEYVKYYKDLEHKYTSLKACEESIKNEFKCAFERKIQAALPDEDSRLATYLMINPNMSKPVYHNKLEFQRTCITRYRTGSFKLKIDKGRSNPYIPREQRLCKCHSIQTIKHVLLHCPLLHEIREKYGVVDVVDGIMNDGFLIEMEHILEIK